MLSCCWVISRWGPMPGQTLEMLAGLGERAIWGHGNCEREMVAAFDGVQW